MRISRPDLLWEKKPSFIARYLDIIAFVILLAMLLFLMGFVIIGGI